MDFTWTHDPDGLLLCQQSRATQPEEIRARCLDLWYDWWQAINIEAINQCFGRIETLLRFYPFIDMTPEMAEITKDDLPTSRAPLGKQGATLLLGAHTAPEKEMADQADGQVVRKPNAAYTLLRISRSATYV